MEKARTSLMLVAVLNICFASGSVLGDAPTAGLISHWALDEGGGITAYDSVGTNDGTLINGPVWTSGIIEGALEFDGVDDYVDVGDPIDGSLDFGAGDSLSIAAWIRSGGESGTFVFKRSCTGIGGSYYEGYGIKLFEHKAYFHFEDNSNHSISIVGHTIVGDNNWHHVVAVRDTGTDEVYLYVDGSSDASPVVDPTTSTLATDKGFDIGHSINTTTGHGYFNGKIDDVRVYERALSAEEIWELAHGLAVAIDIKPGSCPNPLNVKSKGVLPVAILGAEEFDVSSIDAVSVRLAGVEPLRSSYEDVASPAVDGNECPCSEEGPDGYTDLTLKFETQKVVEALGEVNDGDVLTVELTGVLQDGMPIEGMDCILVRGKFKPFNQGDINKNGITDIVDFAMMAETWLESTVSED